MTWHSLGTNTADEGLIWEGRVTSLSYTAAHRLTDIWLLFGKNILCTVILVHCARWKIRGVLFRKLEAEGAADVVIYILTSLYNWELSPSLRKNHPNSEIPTAVMLYVKQPDRFHCIKACAVSSGNSLEKLFYLRCSRGHNSDYFSLWFWG